jgi:hypothetical protein
MDRITEMIDLLREIRDDQRELLELTRKHKRASARRQIEWKQDEDQRYQEWKQHNQAWTAWLEEQRAAAAVWREANEEWLRVQRRSRQAVAVVVWGVLVLLGLVLVGLLAAAGWLG